MQYKVLKKQKNLKYFYLRFKTNVLTIKFNLNRVFSILQIFFVQVLLLIQDYQL